MWKKTPAIGPSTRLYLEPQKTFRVETPTIYWTDTERQLACAYVFPIKLLTKGRKEGAKHFHERILKARKQLDDARVLLLDRLKRSPYCLIRQRVV